jgi:hypothetical protein
MLHANERHLGVINLSQKGVKLLWEATAQARTENVCKETICCLNIQNESNAKKLIKFHAFSRNNQPEGSKRLLQVPILPKVTNIGLHTYIQIPICNLNRLHFCNFLINIF